MQHKIRFVQSKGSSREVRELSLSSDRATLGRGTDQTIQINDRRIPLQHSKLTFKAGTVELRANSGFNFALNDSVARQAELIPGDVVDISGHQLRVLIEDDILVVEIELSDAQPEALRDRFTTRLRQLNIPMRAFSWVLFVLILSIGIIIPSTGIFIGMEPLRQSPLPDDSIWLAGPLHDTHAFLGDKCENCHTVPFVPAQEVDCLNCHLSINHHFDTELLGRDYFIGDTCQDCHREHNGPEAITRRDQPTCTVCHEDLANAGYESDLQTASDFLLNHPAFMVSVLEMQEDQHWLLKRFDMWDDDLEEDSNLKFPHDIHMDPDGVMGQEDYVTMECTDCHGIEKGGMRMKTVTMEQHCASCHDLTFDPASPDRVVPHGAPGDLVNLLRGYYAYEYFQENAEPGSTTVQTAPTPTRKARRPGRRKQLISDFQMDAPIHSGSKAAQEYVDKRVNEAASMLFEQRTCIICHELERPSNSGTNQNANIDANNNAANIKVVPVKLTPDWMPMAEFSHDSHQNMSCEGCHDAAWSDTATDVLMPDIGTCRVCHGGEHAEDKLQSTCISCHKFHLADQGPMGILLAIDEEGNLIDQFGNYVDEEGNILPDLEEDDQFIDETDEYSEDNEDWQEQADSESSFDSDSETGTTPEQ